MTIYPHPPGEVMSILKYSGSQMLISDWGVKKNQEGPVDRDNCYDA